MLGAAAGLLAFVTFDAAFAAGLAAAFATGFALGLAATLPGDFAGFTAGFAARAVFAAGFTVFFAGTAVFAGVFFEAAAVGFFAVAFAVPLPLATTFFAVLRVLFAISVHRCG